MREAARGEARDAKQRKSRSSQYQRLTEFIFNALRCGLQNTRFASIKFAQHVP